MQQRFIIVPHCLLLLTESSLFPFSSEDLPIELGQSVWSFTKELHGMKVVGQYPEAGCILELWLVASCNIQPSMITKFSNSMSCQMILHNIICTTLSKRLKPCASCKFAVTLGYLIIIHQLELVWISSQAPRFPSSIEISKGLFIFFLVREFCVGNLLGEEN